MPINWFEQGGEAYARFRPSYPDQLVDFLATLVPDRRLAVDVGCGTGQMAVQLAKRFDRVIGFDPSQGQLAHAATAQQVRYACANAERLPLRGHCISLVIAAQAAHWFDLPAFYAEVRRVAMADALLVLLSYGVLRLEPSLQERFSRFYQHEIGPYWPAERQWVDTGYAGMDFPFAELSAPSMVIRLDWTLAQLLGYISTWSAVRHAREAGQESLLKQFAEDMAAGWGPASTPRCVTWPIHLRLGRL